MASQPPLRNPNQGPPPFSPLPETLSYLSTSIQIAVQVYENAQSPSEKAAALQRIQTASAKLSRAATPLPAQLLQLNFGPNLNVAVRIAIEMGLFEFLPASGDAISLADLADATKAEEEFLLRIARVLVAFDMLLSPSQGTYAHTPMSRLLLLPPVKASTTHLFDNMLAAQTHSAGSYYTSHSFKSPEDPKNSPFSFANGAMGMGVFDILEKEPERMKVFNSAMTMTAMFGMSQIAGLYPFEKLEANGEGVRLVDVGGGKGHILSEILKVHPGMKGSLVLEDMSVVLEGGVVVGESEGVRLQGYDFFKEVQPIVGELALNHSLASVASELQKSLIPNNVQARPTS